MYLLLVFWFFGVLAQFWWKNIRICYATDFIARISLPCSNVSGLVLALFREVVEFALHTYMAIMDRTCLHRNHRTT